jgi:5-methyltetrahydrofolate--homocysteine methyltransferase
MVSELPALLDAGVRIVGGCCGSTPNHIRLFRRAIDNHEARKAS